LAAGGRGHAVQRTPWLAKEAGRRFCALVVDPSLESSLLGGPCEEIVPHCEAGVHPCSPSVLAPYSNSAAGAVQLLHPAVVGDGPSTHLAGIVPSDQAVAGDGPLSAAGFGPFPILPLQSKEAGHLGCASCVVTVDTAVVHGPHVPTVSRCLSVVIGGAPASVWCATGADCCEEQSVESPHWLGYRRLRQCQLAGN
jgi:hypothetical protein